MNDSPAPAKEEEIFDLTNPAQASAQTPDGYQRHVVGQGECLSSIADAYRTFWKTIWGDAANATLRELRKAENVLLPGDVVFIPAKKLKEHSGSSNSRHRFRRRGVPTRLSVKMIRIDGPRAGEAYRATFDTGEIAHGTLDSTGKMDVRIPSGAESVVVSIGKHGAERQYTLILGGLDPVDSITGLQCRLANLGFRNGEITGGIDAETRSALARFQESQGLNATGVADVDTRNALRNVHGG
jgi:hypothetical protein